MESLKMVNRTDRKDNQETESPHESIENADTSWEERMYTQLNHRQKIEYGDLSDDHPTVQYVRSIARDLLTDGDVENIKIAPDWLSINAAAFVDGTIYISGALLRDVEFTEELAGVIAHELVHVRRDHIKKTQNKINRDRSAGFSEKSVLSQLSMQRGAEYEADLRAVVEELETANVNPLGMKLFLEKLQERERNVGLTHGAMSDRVLNLSSMLHAIDLRSVTSELTPVDSEIISELDSDEHKRNLRPLAAVPFIVRPSTKKDSPAGAKVEKWKLERQAAVGLLRPDEIPTGFQFMQQQIKTMRRLGFTDFSEEKHLLNKMGKDFTREYLPKELDEDDQPIYKILLTGCFLGVSNLKKLDAYITNVDSLDRILQLLQNVNTLPIPYTPIAAKDIAIQILESAQKANIMGDMKTDLSLTTTVVEKIAPAVGNFANRFSVNEPIVISKLSVEMYNHLAQKCNDVELSEVLKKQAENAEPDAVVEELVYSEYPEAAVYAEKLEAVMVPEYDIKAIDSIIVQLAESMVDEPRERIYSNVQNITVRLSGKLMKNVFKEDVKKNIFEDIFSYEGSLSDYLTFRLYSDLLNVMPQFSSLSEKERSWLQAGLSSNFSQSLFYIQRGQETSGFDDEDEYDEVDYYEAMPSRSVTKEKLISRQNLESDAQRLSSKRTLEHPVTKEELADFFNHVGNSAFYEAEFGIKEKKLTYHNRHLFINALLGVAEGDSVSEILDTLEELEQADVPVDWYIEESPTAFVAWYGKLVDSLTSDGEQTLSPKQLLAVGNWIPDPFIKSGYKRYLYDRIKSDIDFDTGLELMFPLQQEDSLGDPKNVESFIETRVNTQEEYRKTKERISVSFDDLMEQGSKEAGLATVFSMFDALQFRNVNSFIKSFLRTTVNEVEVKKVLYDEIVGGKGSGDKSEEWMSKVQKADGALRKLYNLDAQGKALVLRRLLTDPNGALRKPERRREFFDFVLTEWVDGGSEQEDLMKVLANASGALKEMQDWQLLYFALSGTLQNKLLAPPSAEQVVSWAEVYEYESDRKDLGVESNFTNKLDNPTALSAQAKDDPSPNTQAVSDYTNHRLVTFLRENGYATESDSQELSPIEMIKEVASRSGAPGVRFLQLLPQFVDVEAEYQEAFSDVYDKLKGQSKIAAIMQLEREWPDMWSDITSIDDNIGGGSIATVYTATNTNGGKEVIKVRNPNIKYHLNQTYEFAEKLLGRLAKHGGGYAAASVALEDIKDWIEADVDFEDFLTKDKLFKEKHHGFTPPGHDYQIYVPTSQEPQSQYFIREEFVEGANLTEWNHLVAEGHDMKQIISTLVKNYVHQVVNGMVHSDAHIGNFRITPNKEIAILDRNYFLELTSQEQQVITGIFNPFSPATEKARLLREYFVDNGNTVDESQITDISKAINSNDWTLLQKKLITLKQEGVKVPLTLTLLLKNFNALQKLSEKAGFSGLQQAFLFTP